MMSVAPVSPPPQAFSVDVGGVEDDRTIPVTPMGLLLRILQFALGCGAVYFGSEAGNKSEAVPPRLSGPFWILDPAWIADPAWIYFVGLATPMTCWSFGMICCDGYFLATKSSLRNRKVILLFTFGDWMASTFAFAATWTSLGYAVYIQFDMENCPENPCDKYWTAYVLALVCTIIGVPYFTSFFLFLTSGRVPPLGIPGSITSMLLRAGQCIFCGVSLGFLLVNHDFSSSSAYYTLILAIPLEVIWSFATMCYEILLWTHRINDPGPRSLKNLYNGDWIIGVLTFMAINWSGGVLTHVYHAKKCPPMFAPDISNPLIHTSDCTKFLISIGSASVGWLLIAVSSLVLLQLSRADMNV